MHPKGCLWMSSLFIFRSLDPHSFLHLIQHGKYSRDVDTAEVVNLVHGAHILTPSPPVSWLPTVLTYSLHFDLQTY